MIDFLCSIYRKLVNVLAVVYLIVFGYLGYKYINFFYPRASLSILGIIIGLLIGLLFEALVFPPAVILFNIDERAYWISKKMNDMITISKSAANSSRNMIPQEKGQEKTLHTPFFVFEYTDKDFGNKELWISKRIMKLIEDGYRASDAKAQAEAEYVIGSIEIKKQKEYDKKKEASKESTDKKTGTFIYEEHEEKFASFISAKELLEYLESLNLDDEFFNDEVLPKIRDLAEIETFKIKKLTKALDILKKMTA